MTGTSNSEAKEKLMSKIDTRWSTLRGALCVAAAAATMLAAVAVPALAKTTTWLNVDQGTPRAWNDSSNWDNGVPEDGDTIGYDEALPGNYMPVDTKGATIYLPNATLSSAYDTDVFMFYHSDYVIPDATPTSGSSFTPVLAYASPEDAAAASPTMTLKGLAFSKGADPWFYMPVVTERIYHSNIQPSYPVFYGPLTVTQDVTMQNSGFILTLRNTANIDTLNFIDGAIKSYKPVTLVTAATWTAGTWNVMGDGGLPVQSGGFHVSAGCTMNITVA